MGPVCQIKCDDCFYLEKRALFGVGTVFVMNFESALNGEPGPHYLCAGYKKFFMHIRRYLRPITQLLDHGLPAPMIMQAFDGPLVIALGGARTDSKEQTI